MFSLWFPVPTPDLPRSIGNPVKYKGCRLRHPRSLCLQFSCSIKPGISGKTDLLDNDPIDIAFLETLVVPHVTLTVLGEREPWPIVLREDVVVAVDQFQSQVTPFTIDLVELHVDLNGVVDAGGHRKLKGPTGLRFSDGTPKGECSDIQYANIS